MYKRCFNDIFIMNLNDICPNTCSDNGTCNKSTGCICNPGYNLHDCSLQSKCKSNCNQNGFCHNNAKCACYPGWLGIECSTQISCPKNCTTTDNGLCQSDSTCKCNPGYTGDDCGELTTVGNESNMGKDPFSTLTAIEGKRIDDLLKANNITGNGTNCYNNCSNHGKCDMETLECKCEEGFSGRDCGYNKNGNKTSIKTRKEDPEEEDEYEEEEEEQMIFYVGPKQIMYMRTYDCSGNCTQKGICLNSTCSCYQGYTSYDCSMTYKNYLKKGFRLKSFILFFIIAFVVAAVITLIVKIKNSGQVIRGDVAL